MVHRAHDDQVDSMPVTPEVFDKSSSPETFCNYPLDAVIVLGAFMKKSSQGWKIPTYIEEDPGKIVGGHSRAIAVRQLFDERYAPRFIVTGGVQRDTDKDASRADILANLITQKYGVPDDQVVPITTVGNTLGNLHDTVSYLERNKAVLKKRKIGILSNDWHLPRAGIFFQDHPYFTNNAIELVELSVEDILMRRSKRYKGWVEKVRNSDAMKIRIELEAQGIEDYFAGRYKPLNA